MTLFRPFPTNLAFQGLVGDTGIIYLQKDSSCSDVFVKSYAHFLHFQKVKLFKSCQISRGVLFHPIRLKIYLCATLEVGRKNE